MNVVVVESPAKAKTINKYLGSDFTVLASYGHVRDLPSKDGSVRPAEDFAMSWEVDERAEKHIKAIAQALKGAKRLFLATDPDREGEAISWHVESVLRQRKALDKIDVKRVVFNEVTRNAVLEAMKNPRELDRDLVDAYLARRALDYLVGFTLSPVLWRKLPGAKSAGRVQSVALRLVCERETEIEKFKPREYWSVEADLRGLSGEILTARLTHLDGAKLDKFDLPNQGAAAKAVDAIKARKFSVSTVERKRVRRNPYPPFTTSTLQQEASRKLGLGASRTMRVAQRLYEGIDIGGETVGLITYMRTDSVQLSREAIAATRDLIGKQYGPNYVPESPRVYRTQAKNAQEAHEAIRPTDLFRRPEDVAGHLDEEERRLYDLIWRRTVACEMESAALDQVAVDIASPDKLVVMRATGSVIAFDGFLRVYREDRDDPTEDEDESRILPPLKEGQALEHTALRPDQHFTQPPPRYSEASLVKRLEELGIGRPSTYASILQVLQDRGYVRLEKKRFIPEDRGRLVTAFLSSFFERYVQYNFTAELENQLDDISGGRLDWKTVLQEFWKEFSTAVEGTRDLSIKMVIDALDADLGPHFFPAGGAGHDPRLCPACTQGRIGLKLGRFGAFIGCSRYPECRYTRRLAVESEDGQAVEGDGTRQLGTDPASNQPVSLRQGPYGRYLQLGEAAEGAKPKRASVPKDVDVTQLDLNMAIKLLALPRDIGIHPQSGKMISAGIGRFGPYLKHDGAFRSAESTSELLTMGINRAVSLLAEPAKGRRVAAPLRELGAHPTDGRAVTLNKGQFGPYVKHDGVYANLPRGAEIDAITLDEAVKLLAERKAKSDTGSKRKGTARKGAAKADVPPKAGANGGKKRTASKRPAKSGATAKLKKAPGAAAKPRRKESS
ncbi:MAG: type I DNA topoisomerase [Rhodospirillaceae bacterium]|nr:type I DNA topoisomerase [Rhodospirillaceae bacterium]